MKNDTRSINTLRAETEIWVHNRTVDDARRELGIDLSSRNEVMAVGNNFDLLAVKIKHNKTSPNSSFFSSCQ